MPVEAKDHNIGADLEAAAKPLTDWLTATLEQYDGLCLDNEAERTTLATSLTAALLAAAESGQLTEMLRESPLD